jgi:hypothetical protein
LEKVHYPLSLNYEENVDPDKLKNTIKKLKVELDEAKSQKEFERSTGKSDSFYVSENVDKKMNSTNSSI